MKSKMRVEFTELEIRNHPFYGRKQASHVVESKNIITDDKREVKFPCNVHAMFKVVNLCGVTEFDVDVKVDGGYFDVNDNGCEGTIWFSYNELNFSLRVYVDRDTNEIINANVDVWRDTCAQLDGADCDYILEYKDFKVIEKY